MILPDSSSAQSRRPRSIAGSEGGKSGSIAKMRLNPGATELEEALAGLTGVAPRDEYRCATYNVQGAGDAGLRQRVKHDDGLVGARHNRFGDGDELVLLAEDTEARRLRTVGFELGGGPGGQFHSSRLNLRR